MRQAQLAATTALWIGIALAQGPPPPGGQSGDGVWLRDAYFGEAQTFDACVGHQPPSGQYHHHASPVCLRAQLNDNIELVRSARTGPVYRETAGPWKHSPILGWAFDGYPIYGPYAFSDISNASSPVRRMRSGFRLRTITERTSLPDWALPMHAGVSQSLPAAQNGPKVSTLFPCGRYLEDYEYVDGLGDLDVYNGRFAVTPEYPQGTYAYFTTINEAGAPAFPYILGAQFYGGVSGGNAATVPAGIQELAAGGGGSTTPQLTAWMTANANQAARVVLAFNPAAGPKTTWPTDVPAGVRTNGGVSSPANADIQRIRYSDSAVYVNGNGLASYVMGPWFDALQPGGVFGGMPSVQNLQIQFPRAPAAAATKRNTGLGVQGIWVNGVAVFNFLDGSSYSNARGTDVGGGLVGEAAVHVSAASFEGGPAATGSLMAAFPLFGSAWAEPFGGATATVKDASGVEHIATVTYASARQVNYRVPVGASPGYATVTIRSGAVTLTGNINIRESYPHLFSAGAESRAVGYVLRARGERQSVELLEQAIDVGPSSDEVFLILYGSGLGNVTNATATIGGVSSPVAYAGTQSGYEGVDQFNVLVPRALAGRGRVDVVISADGRPANRVTVTIR